MNALMLRRLFKAMGEGRPALMKVAGDIVSEERKRGHDRLAGELESYLAKTAHDAPAPLERGAVHELRPLSKQQELLVTVTRPEQLQHHMVLPATTEFRFARIEREYSARDRLAAHALTPKRRILLYGPPGCGKTLGASRLAYAFGLPLLKVRFDSLVSSLFGETASNLRKVFEHAQRVPSVLLLDECDYIARSRTFQRDIGEASRVVNTLLQLLEDFQGPGVLVATTNISDQLDSALFRRFDDAFLIPPPEREEIERLLRMTLSTMPTKRLRLEAFSRQLLGTSAADVVRVAQDAAKIAVLGGGTEVTTKEMEGALVEHKRRQGSP